MIEPQTTESDFAETYSEMNVVVTVVTGQTYRGMFGRENDQIAALGMVTLTDESGDCWVDLNPAHIVSITHDGEWAVTPS